MAVRGARFSRFAPELPDEYIFSNDAKGNNKRKRKAKAKLATGLDEAAQSATAPDEESGVHKERTYNRRHFAFAVPLRHNGGYRAYSADLVSYVAGGKEWLYDVVNIKDAPGISADLAQLPSRIAPEGTSRIPAEKGVSENSIAYPAEPVIPLSQRFNPEVSDIRYSVVSLGATMWRWPRPNHLPQKKPKTRLRYAKSSCQSSDGSSSKKAKLSLSR